MPIRCVARRPWITAVISERTGRREEPITTQHHFRMEGRDIIRTATPADFAADPTVLAAGKTPEPAPDGTLFPDGKTPKKRGAW